MKSMELKPEDTRPELAQPSYNQSKYPYGLTIHLDELSLKKLGLKELPEVGTMLMLKAKVEVCATSSSETHSGENRSLGLQICAMELGKKTVDPDRFYKK